MNEYLPEDRDPMRCWLIVAAVAFVTLLVLGVGSGDETPIEQPKKLYINPPSATRIQLPGGRHLAYEEQGVSADRARFSLIAPHSFLSSRLAGIPGINTSFLEEFGARLVTYDFPGFGESDRHLDRNLNSSALYMLHLAEISAEMSLLSTPFIGSNDLFETGSTVKGSDQQDARDQFQRCNQF